MLPWPGYLGQQIWGWPGLAPKVTWPSISTKYSTEMAGHLLGAVLLPSQDHLLQPLLLWMASLLVLITMSEWERCLLLELECGVLSRQEELVVSCIASCVRCILVAGTNVVWWSCFKVTYIICSVCCFLCVMFYIDWEGLHHCCSFVYVHY